MPPDVYENYEPPVDRPGVIDAEVLRSGGASTQQETFNRIFGEVAWLSAHEAAFAANFMGVHLGEVQAQRDAVAVPGLVVGMAPGPHTSPSLPMFPWPEGSAGGRLLAMSGMSPAAYLGRLRRVNLCDGPFHRVEARRTAARLIVEHRTPRGPEPTPRLVLCGRRVAGAFDLPEAAWFARLDLGGFEVSVIPHPSGRSKEYNDPAVARAREAVRWAARMEGE